MLFNVLINATKLESKRLNCPRWSPAAKTEGQLVFDLT